MKRLRKVLLCNLYLILLIVVICFSLIINKLDRKSKIPINSNNLIGVVKEIKRDKDKISFVIQSNEKVLCNYFTEEDIKLSLGDKISVSGELKIPTNNTTFNTFNYKKYLKNNNIYKIMNVKKLEVMSKTNNIFYKVKNLLIKRIDTYKVKNYLYTFILGNKDYLSNDVYESYRNNGIVHLFCISGNHITLLVGIILFVFKRLKINIILSYFIVFIILIFYMFLTDYGASVLRSGLFFILLGLKKLSYLKLNVLDVFYLTIIILLLINSKLLNDIGFLYSASITYGLLISKRLIKGNYIRRVLIISFISTLISLPITINNFYEINLMGIIYNILFVPVVSFIVTPLSFLVLLMPFLEFILIYLINLLETISLFLNNIHFYLVAPKINLVFIIIYYCCVYLFLKKENKYLLYICFLIVFVKVLPIIDNSYYVYFLDVNQGDSTLIKHKDDIFLIDTGGIVTYGYESDYKVTDNTILLIKSLGFKSIDYLILTHGDFDHMGETINLVNNFKVEKVIFNCGPYNDLEKELIKVLDKKKIKYYSCIKELNIDNNKLYFLQTQEYDNENDNSNVIYTELNGYKFMFMGDASSVTEKEILDKYNLSDIDVLKVGHHGSKTSSGKSFIEKINPKYSIISVGKNNRYGHPNSNVLENLKDSKIYRTDQNGTIMFNVKNNKLKVETCNP